MILDKVKDDRFSEFHDLAPRGSIIFFSFQGSKELTSLDMKIFLIALENYFTSMPSDYILFFVIVSDTDCGLVKLFAEFHVADAANLPFSCGQDTMKLWNMIIDMEKDSFRIDIR